MNFLAGLNNQDLFCQKRALWWGSASARLGFSQKCPMVSTSLGADGYRVRSGCEMYLADSAEAFADDCIRLIREPEKAGQMAERAQ
jgi:hypothetical protein